MVDHTIAQDGDRTVEAVGHDVDALTCRQKAGPQFHATFAQSLHDLPFEYTARCFRLTGGGVPAVVA